MNTDGKTTTSGAPLRHAEYTRPPLHIPNELGQPVKTELVISRDPDGSTIKMNWWHLPDVVGGRKRPHNHPWSFDSDVLHGGFTEERYTPVDSKPGYFSVTTLTHKAGDKYTLRADEFHVVTAVEPGTVTRMTCGKAAPENEWGYIEVDASEYSALGQVRGEYTRAQKDPAFQEHFERLNPFLKKK
jgi:hypothetical protein